MSDSGIKPQKIATARFSGRSLAIAAVLAAGALFGCATISSAMDEDIYYSSQAEADADLARFEADNPSCQLWTNWQKICSRIGTGADTTCSIDPTMPVRPSTPFCVDVTQEERQVFLATHAPLLERESEVSSRSRFCREVDGVITCKAARPFDGHGLAARRHELCEIWSESEAPDFTPVCSESGNIPGLPRCDASQLNGFRSKSPLYCSLRAGAPLNSACPGQMEGWGNGPDYPYTPPYFAEQGHVGELPVIGLYCSN